MTISDPPRIFSVSVESEGGCRIWRGRLNNRGYGLVNVGGKTYSAHRYAWMVANDRPVPPGMMVLHRCDTPACVAEQHLFLGTGSDNLRDAAAKGRLYVQRFGGRRGETSPTARLTWADVRAIRDRLGQSESYVSIASDYGVTASAIYDVAHQRTWKEIP